MNIHKNSALLEHLASSYALGTLKGGARRRFEVLATRHSTIRAGISHWQERLGGLNELSPEVTPSLNVWKRISNLLPHNSISHSAKVVPQDSLIDELKAALDGVRARLQWWQRASWGLALASTTLLVGSVVLTQQVGEANTTATQFVAVLSDDKAADTVLVTFDAKAGQLKLKRLSGYSEGAEKSLQLWAIDTSQTGSGKPESLGVLSAETVIQLTADTKGASKMQRQPLLAVSLEPKGGVSGEKGPTGPVLFKGQLRSTSF
jgi:anti-sigma-K factor RskA